MINCGNLILTSSFLSSVASLVESVNKEKSSLLKLIKKRKPYWTRLFHICCDLLIQAWIKAEALLAFSHIAMHVSSAQCVNILETFNAYQYRIYKLDFWSYNFHLYQFSRSGKVEVDVYRFMSKHSSDHYVLFCHTSPSMCHHAWSCCTQGQILSYTAQFDTTLRNKCYDKSWNAQIDKSLLKICHYQQNVPQHYYLLDTLV